MPDRQTVWLRALTATRAKTTQSAQCGFVYVSSGYRGPRVSQRNVIGVDTDKDQSAWELSQAPIFLVSMFVLWYVFYVASHMDISRDVVEVKKPFLLLSSDTFVFAEDLNHTSFWGLTWIYEQWFLLCLSQGCKVSETGYGELLVFAQILNFCWCWCRVFRWWCSHLCFVHHINTQECDN